jgi:hypothetical protein
MIWLLPFAGLGLLGGATWPMLIIFIAAMVVPLFYPSPQYLIGLTMWQTIILMCRNLAILVVWITLIKEFWCANREAEVGLTFRALQKEVVRNESIT